MKFTGQSDYKSLKPYIDITESAKGHKIIFAELNTNLRFALISCRICTIDRFDFV